MSAGLGGGVIAGMLGIGGGPLYIVIFGIFINQQYGTNLTEVDQVKLIVANVIFVKLFAALFGSLKQIREGNFYGKPVFTISFPAIIVALLISYQLQFIEIDKGTFSIIFVVMMTPMLLKMILDDSEKKKFNHPFSIKVLFLNLVGVLSGTFSALCGLGGGLIIVPLLNGLFNIKIRKVISISLGVILVVCFVLTIQNVLLYDFSDKIPYSFGAISLALSMPVVVGVSIASPLGVYLSKKLSPFMLRMLFIVFCVSIMSKTIYDIFS